MLAVRLYIESAVLLLPRGKSEKCDPIIKKERRGIRQKAGFWPGKKRKAGSLFIFFLFFLFSSFPSIFTFDAAFDRAGGIPKTTQKKIKAS